MRYSDHSVGKRLAALGLAAGLATPLSASAFGVETLPSAGLHLSYTFGGQRAFGVGADLLTSTGNLWDCSRRTVVGSYLSATWMNFSYARLGLGLHGGYSPSIMLGADAEVGYVRTTAHAGLPGITGFTLASMGLSPSFIWG